MLSAIWCLNFETWQNLRGQFALASPTPNSGGDWHPFPWWSTPMQTFAEHYPSCKCRIYCYFSYTVLLLCYSGVSNGSWPIVLKENFLAVPMVYLPVIVIYSVITNCTERKHLCYCGYSFFLISFLLSYIFHITFWVEICTISSALWTQAWSTWTITHCAEKFYYSHFNIHTQQQVGSHSLQCELASPGDWLALQVYSREGQLPNFIMSSRAAAAAGPPHHRPAGRRPISHERRADWPPAARPTSPVRCELGDREMRM